MWHVPEDSERGREEMVKLGVSEDELGAEDYVGVVGGAEKMSVEMAEMVNVWGLM